MTYPRARQTIYKGIKMRSRLESDFAAWLDMQGWIWEYEPNAFGNEDGVYLPDFVAIIDRGQNTYIEVKPTMEEARKHCHRMLIILDSDPTARLWVVTGEWNPDRRMSGFSLSPWLIWCDGQWEERP